MGMKVNSGHFKNTNGYKRGLYGINLQMFSSSKISKKGSKLLSRAKDKALKNTIIELYRPGAKIGDGGTADAIRYELKTGKKVGGKSHILKGEQRLRSLNNFLKRNDISAKDRKIAKKLASDLGKALGGK